MNNNSKRESSDMNVEESKKETGVDFKNVNKGRTKKHLKGKNRAPQESRGIKAYNDVSWWFQDEAMARDAASIWFTQRVGESRPDETVTLMNGEVITNGRLDTYGIMRVNFVPTYGVTGLITSDGYSSYDTSAINTALNKIYWDVVHANSRNISYEASDLGRLFICMDNVYMMLTDAVRAYGIMSKYSTINPYYGKKLVAACGWDYDSLVANIAQFRYKINVLVNLVNKIHVPKVYNIFAAHSNMCNRIFLDGDSERAQMYVTVPNGYYKYNDATGEITWQSFDDQDPDNPAALKHYIKDLGYLDIIQDRIQEILNSQYMGVMDGDLLKRYGEEAMFKVPTVDENEETAFVYDPEFMLMLANANFIGLPGVYMTSGTTPEPRRAGVHIFMKQPTVNTALLQIVIQYRNFGVAPNYANLDVDVKGLFPTYTLNLPEGVPASPETVMLSTRMICKHDVPRVGLPNENTVITEITSVGTMLGEYCTLFYDTIGAGGNPEFKSVDTIWHINTSSASTVQNATPVFRAAKQFAVTPRVLMAKGYSNPYYDIDKVDNFAFVNEDTIRKLNYVAISSIFTEVNASPYGWANK